MRINYYYYYYYYIDDKSQTEYAMANSSHCKDDLEFSFKQAINADSSFWHKDFAEQVGFNFSCNSDDYT